MSGICGIFDMSGGGRLKDGASKIDAMLSKIKHRGPNGNSAYISPDYNCAIGHNRLVISEQNSGEQVFYDGEENVFAALDGEIYNYLEVKKELDKIGRPFKSSSDVEAIIRLYESFAISFPTRMNGIFAAVIYDERKKKIFFARDRVGVKPLFIAENEGFLYFSSEIKSLLIACPSFRGVSENALYEYLIYGYVAAPFSIYPKIKKIMPAHAVSYDTAGGRVEEAYWRLRYAPEHGRTINSFSNELLSTLKESVKSCISPETETGAYLTGGLNTSTIVALMSKISSLRIKTFAMGFDEDESSDLRLAARVSEMFDCEHFTFNLKSREVELIPKILAHMDEPLANHSLLPVYQSAQIASNHARVVVTGDGADELFGGYERYLWEVLAGTYTKIPKLLRKSLIERLIKFLPASTNNIFEDEIRRIKNFMEYSAYDPNYRNLSFTSYFSGETLRAIIPDFEKNKNLIVSFEKKYETAFSEQHFESWLSKVLFSDFYYLLGNDVVVRSERSGSAHSIEHRSPFLDYRVIELAMKIPIGYKIRNMSLKNILKTMMHDILPLYILHRPKTGYVPPLNKWLKSDLRELLSRALLGGSSFVASALNKKYIKYLIDVNHGGLQNFSNQLWNLFIFEIWHRMFIANKSDEAPTCYKDLF